MSSSLKTGKFIFIWALVSPHCLSCWGCWEPLDLSDSDDIEEAVNTELLSLSNLWSRDGNGGWGGGSPWSLLHQLQFWPLGGWWGNSWWSELASLGVSFWGESPRWSNLNGCWGWQIHTWMPWTSCLYPAFCYGPGNLPPTFLNS